MLLNMRDKFSGWIKWLIVGVLIVVFALWGMSYYLEGGSAAQATALTVNGQKITQGQIQNMVTRLSQQAAAQNQVVDGQKLKQEAEKILITRTLLLQAAQKSGLSIPDVLISQSLADIWSQNHKGPFSARQFEQELSQRGLTLAQLQSQLKQEFLLQQLEAGLKDTGFVLPQEVAQLLALQQQTRAVSVAKVPFARFEKSAHISVDQAKAYYQAHAQTFMQPEEVKLKYVQLSLAELKASLQPTEQTLKDYYQQNIALFSTPEKREVEWVSLAAKNQGKASQQALVNAINEVRGELEKGQSVSDIVKAKQADYAKQQLTISVHHKWLKYDLHNPIAANVFKLPPRAGLVSQPISDDQKTILAKVVAIQKAQPKPYAQIQSQVKQRYIASTAAQKYQDLSTELNNAVANNAMSLAPAIKALGLKVHYTSWFTRKGTKSGLASHQKVVQAAFSSAVLENKMNSQVIALPDNKMVAVRLQDYRPARERPFKEVESEIISTLRQEQAVDQAKAFAQKALKTIETKQDLKQAATQFDLKWSTYPHLAMDSKDFPAQVVRAMFNHFGPQKGQAFNAGLYVDSAGKMVYLFAVQSVHVGSAKKADDQMQQSVQKVLSIAREQQTISQYLAMLKAGATIQYADS